MNARFTGRVALVTGAGSGIGRATARAFAGEGAIVVVAGRNEGPLRETVEAVTAAGGSASLVTADVAVEADAERLVRTVVERHGRLDVAVNNAGVFLGGPVADIDREQWQRLWDINVTGVMLALKHQTRQMRAQGGGGAIVNIGSNLGAHKSAPNLAAYGASKAAVSALSKAAALENIDAGIRVNVVSPGASDTSMSMASGEDAAGRARRMAETVPLGRVGALSEVAAAILFAAGAESGFAVGHDLVIDGGVSL